VVEECLDRRERARPDDDGGEARWAEVRRCASVRALSMMRVNENERRDVRFRSHERYFSRLRFHRADYLMTTLDGGTFFDQKLHGEKDGHLLIFRRPKP
jgi:hypothetical protein